MKKRKIYTSGNIRFKRFVANISIILYTIILFNVASNWSEFFVLLVIIIVWLPMVIAYGFYISGLMCPYCGAKLTCKFEQGHYQNKILSPLCVPKKCLSCGKKIQ